MTAGRIVWLLVAAVALRALLLATPALALALAHRREFTAGRFGSKHWAENLHWLHTASDDTWRESTVAASSYSPFLMLAASHWQANAAATNLIADTVSATLLATLSADANAAWRAAAVFALSPLSVLSCASLSWVHVLHCTFVATVAAAHRGLLMTTPIIAAITVAIDPAYAILVPAVMALLLHQRSQQSPQKSARRAVSECLLSAIHFVAWLTIALGVTRASLSADWCSLLRSYLSPLTFQSLSPSVGPQWYLFTELFDRFRSFFLVTLTALPVFLVGPIIVRYSDQPLVALQLSLVIKLLLDAQPVVGDLSVSLALFALTYTELAPHYRKVYLPVFAGFVSLCFQPLMSFLWLGPGSGNANFLYFQCLLLNMALTFLTIEHATAARIRRTTCSSPSIDTETPTAAETETQIESKHIHRMPLAPRALRTNDDGDAHSDAVDPHSLTVQQLKSWLTQLDVALPSTQQVKQFYVNALFDQLPELEQRYSR